MSIETNNSQKVLIIKILSLILSFFLFISMMLLSTLYIAKSTFLNKDFFKKQIIESSYPQNLLLEMENVFLSYGIVSGFDEQFFKQTITLDKVIHDINLEVDRLYLGNTVTVFNDMKEHIYNSAINNVKSRGFDIFDEQNKIVDQQINDSISYFAEICADAYYGYIKLPASEKIFSIIEQANKAINFLFLVTIVSIIFLVIIIFMINLSLKDKFLYCIYAFTSSLVFLAIPIIFSIYSNFINNIAINNKALYYFIVTYFNSCINVIKNVTFTIAFILILLIIIRLLSSSKKTN